MHLQFARISSLDDLDKLIARCRAAKRFGFDTETTGLDSRWHPTDGQTRSKIVGVCLAFNPTVGFYIPVGHVAPYEQFNLPVNEVMKRVAGLLLRTVPKPLDPKQARTSPITYEVAPDSTHTRAYFFNQPYDSAMVAPWMPKHHLWHHDSFEDVQLMRAVAQPQFTDHSLKGTTREFFPDLPVASYDSVTEGKSFAELDPTALDTIQYAGSDAIFTFRLAEMLRSTLGTDEQTYICEKAFTNVIRHISQQTTLVDCARAQVVIEDVRARAAVSRAEVVAAAEARGYKDFLLTSPQKVSHFFFGGEKEVEPKRKRDLPYTVTGFDAQPKPTKTATGFYQTDIKTLDQYKEHPEIGELVTKHLEAKQLTTLARGTLKTISESDGEVYTSTKQCGAVTGRMSTSIPKAVAHGINLFSTPKDPLIRSLFLPPPGWVTVDVDIVNEEVWLAGMLSGQSDWVGQIESGVDLHDAMAIKLFGPDFTSKQRKIAKALRFAIGYGGGPRAVKRGIGGSSREADQMLAVFKAAHPEYFGWAERAGKHLTRRAPYVYTPFGRKISCGIYNAARRITDVPAYLAGNRIIQGTGVCILRRAAVALMEQIHAAGAQDSVRVHALVHDEVVCHCTPELAERVARWIDRAITRQTDALGWRRRLRCDASTGKSWASETKIDLAV
jgi:DNA polymerase I